MGRKGRSLRGRKMLFCAGGGRDLIQNRYKKLINKTIPL